MNREIELLRPLRGFVNLLTLIVAANVIFEVGVLAAQPDSEPSGANRWLLILETSRAMLPKAPAAQNIAAGLVATGMNGQMQNGDTLGFWTFNETLKSGEFPLQDWTSQNSKIVAGRVHKYISAQNFEKIGRLETVGTEMNEVIKASDFITVIIISEGSSPIAGTPFDAKINASFKEWQEQQKKSQMPFVTLLRATKGKITDYVVNTPPFPLDLPPLPEELLNIRAEQARKVRAAAEPKTNARPVVPNLIITGKKPQTNTAPAEIPEAPVDPIASSKQPDQVQPAPLPTIPPVAAPPSTSVQSQEIAPIDQSSVKNVAPASAANRESTGQAEQKPMAAAPVEENSLKPETDKTLPVQNAVSLPKESSEGMIIWIVVPAVLALALLVGFVFVRRNRQSTQASLITRSLDRDQR